MNFALHHTRTAVTTSATRRRVPLWISLAAVLFLGSAPAFGQAFHFTPVVPGGLARSIQGTPDAELPVRQGMPSLRKRLPAPDYPAEAAQRKVEGRVLVDFVVDERGRVVRSEVREGLGYGCDEAALRVLERVRFRPVRGEGGQPQRARFVTAFEFKPDEVR